MVFYGLAQNKIKEEKAMFACPTSGDQVCVEAILLQKCDVMNFMKHFNA